MHTFKLAACLVFGVLLSGIGWAASDFELPLTDLKKPSLPSVPKKSGTKAATSSKSAEASSSSGKTKSKKRSRKHRAETTEPSAPPVAATTITTITTLTTTPAKPGKTVVTIDEPIPTEEITIKPGLPCRLAGQVASTLAAEADKTAPLLQGLKLAPVAVAHHEGVTVVITCGLPVAELYTVSRLLETRKIQLLNMSGEESTQQVIEGVVNSLGFAYQLEHGEKGTNYLIALESDKDTMLKLVINP